MPSARTLRCKALGKCVRCPNDAPLGGSVCYACIDKMAAQKRQALAAGNCQNCWRNPHEAGSRFCTSCKDGNKKRLKERYYARKQAGICVDCGRAPAWHGRTTCQYCWRKSHGLSV